MGHCPLGLAAGCLLPAQHATDDRPPTRQCCHRVKRKLAQSISQGEWGVGLLGLPVAGLSEVFFTPDPKVSSPPLLTPPYPPLPFSCKYCSQNFRKLKNKEQRVRWSFSLPVPFASQP